MVHLANFKASGADLLIGSGRFIGPKTVQVELSGGGTPVIRGKPPFDFSHALGP